MIEDAPCDIMWQSNNDVGNIDQLLALVLDGLDIRTTSVGFISIHHRESRTVNMLIDILNRTIGGICFQTSYAGILDKYYKKFDTMDFIVAGLWFRSGIDRTVWNIDHLTEFYDLWLNEEGGDTYQRVKKKRRTNSSHY